MIEAADAAVGFVAGRTRRELDENRMLLFALVRAVEIIGEAASKVSDGGRQSAPDIPWTQITATRNRLVHAYFDVDRDIVWRTATSELPLLLPGLRRLVQSERTRDMT